MDQQMVSTAAVCIAEVVTPYKGQVRVLRKLLHQQNGLGVEQAGPLPQPWAWGHHGPYPGAACCTPRRRPRSWRSHPSTTSRAETLGRSRCSTVSKMWEASLESLAAVGCLVVKWMRDDEGVCVCGMQRSIISAYIMNVHQKAQKQFDLQIYIDREFFLQVCRKSHVAH